MQRLRQLVRRSGLAIKKPGARCSRSHGWQLVGSGFAVAAQNVLDLVGHHALDCRTGRPQVLAGVEMAGILGKILADGRGHGQAQVRVDVDLADRHAGRLAQHVLRNADRVRHVAAVGVDHLNIFRDNRAGAVQHDREPGQALFDFLKDVEAQLRLGAGLELVGAVAGPDGNRQGVAVRPGDEVIDLVRVGVGRVGFGNIDVVLDAGQSAQFGLDHDAAGVGIFDNLAGHLDVLFITVMRAVDHDGGEAAVDAALAELERVAVIQVQGDGQIGLDQGRLHQLDQVGMVGVFTGAGRNLQDQGGLQVLGRLGDTLDDLHVVDIESTDGVTAFIGFLEHLFRVDEWHNVQLLLICLPIQGIWLPLPALCQTHTGLFYD